MISMPDFELYYERMMTKGSRVNMFYCWRDYKSEHPNGYQSSQFYEYFNRFIEKNYGGDKVAMALERIPGERRFKLKVYFLYFYYLVKFNNS